MQSRQIRSSTRSRRRAGALFVVLAACVAPVTATLGCSDDKASFPPGAVPTVVSVDAVTLDPPKNDAGELVGGCCSFTATVTFAPLPEGELIREAHVQWALLGGARFQYPASEASDAGANNQITFTADVPPSLVVRGAKLAFTVILVSGRGERSNAAGSTLTLK